MVYDQPRVARYRSSQFTHSEDRSVLFNMLSIITDLGVEFQTKSLFYTRIYFVPAWVDGRKAGSNTAAMMTQQRRAKTITCGAMSSAAHLT